MGDDNNDIKALIQRIRRGDREARRELIGLLADDGQLGDVLRRIARKMLPANHRARRILDSHDAVQSALCTALEKLSMFRGETEGSLFGWLKSIIRTKVCSATDRVDHPLRAQPTEDSTSPLETLAFKNLVAEVHNAIQDLPLDQRIVVELRLRGLTAVDSATILGLNSDAVRKRHERAVRNLRRVVKGD